MTVQPVTVQPFSRGSNEGTSIWHMGALMTFKAVGSDTGGQFWLAEQTSVQGYQSPLHRHTREDELFVVLDGELSVRVGDDTHRVASGAIAYAPRLLPHTFRVESGTAKFLILTTPAGFEQWFLDTGEPAQELTVPPPPTGPPDVQALMSSLASYGVEVLGPPPS